MSNLKVFLKVLSKDGYPNPDIISIAKMVNYDLDNFLIDLKNELGEQGVIDFCEKAISKLSTPKGIKVEFGPENGEYVYYFIDVVTYDEDESENDVIVKLKQGDSKVLWVDDDGNETHETLEYISDNIGMGEWGDYDDMIDYIRGKLYNVIQSNCGFGIWVY